MLNAVWPFASVKVGSEQSVDFSFGDPIEDWCGKDWL